MVSQEFSLCISIIDSEEKAKKIGNEAVERRLAAGVNIIPAGESVYRWKGEIETKNEIVMMFYTRSSLGEALGTLIKEMHSYEVPPITFICIDNALPEFLEWIGSNTASHMEDY